MKIRIILSSILVLIFLPAFLYADDKTEFQNLMRTILETGGKVKSISDDLKPSRRLYLYQQLPSMKSTIAQSESIIRDIKEEASKKISNKNMQNVIQDTASLQLITILVTKELLEVYENNGSISEYQYRSVINRYKQEAERLTKSLEKYKNM